MGSRQSIQELTKRLKELKSRLPAHSLPPSLLEAIEDLEDQIHQLRSEAPEDPNAPHQNSA